MSTNEEFLSAFRSLEAAVKSHGYDSVLAFEGMLEEKEKKECRSSCSSTSRTTTNYGSSKSELQGAKDASLAKIRICRQVRNYLSHESQNFIIANKEMVDFLNDYAGKLSSIELPVKKFMEKNLVLDTMKVQQALGILSRRKYGHDVKEAPVFDKNGKVVGVISYAHVGKYLAKNRVLASTNVSDVMGKAPKSIRNISENVHMKEVDEWETYLVKNSKGEAVGWY